VQPRLGFAEKPGTAFLIADVNELQRNRSILPGVMYLVDTPHAACTDQRDDRVGAQFISRRQRHTIGYRSV
jgi:hypothetical protein